MRDHETGDVISRQATIEHLKKRLYETELNSTAEYPYYEDIADNRVDIWMNEVPSAQQELPWIPCKKQLPAEEGDYFVTVDPRYVPPGYRSTDVITWRDGKWVMADYFVLDSEGRKKPDFKVVELAVPIIAWMSLPKEYQEGKG